MPVGISRKHYINGSAYWVGVQDNVDYNGTASVSVSVAGKLYSSRVRYQIVLRRGTTTVSTFQRIGIVLPKQSKTIEFTNISPYPDSRGPLNVLIRLQKLGGTTGQKFITEYL